MTSYIKFSEFCKNRYKYLKQLDKQSWQVLEPIRYYIDYNNKNEYVQVPKGFVFDFNSVPRIFWNIIAPQDFAIAVIHDFLYSNGGEVIKKYKKLSKIFSLDEKRIIGETFGFSEDHLVIDRYLCDKICFLGIFIEYREIRKKITWKIKLKALLWYFGVRIGGKKHFYD